MNRESAAQAAAALRELDRDRYFATLVLPERIRPAVTALHAFSAEIAAIRERAREAMPGEIRLQWWKDALEGQGHGEVRHNPIADALLSAVEEFSLPAAPLVRLVEARRFDLYHDPMPDLASFEGYAGETVSVLFQLSAMIASGGPAAEAADAAGHLGVAVALTGHLRAFGYNAARGRLFLPLSVFAANGVTLDQILAGQSGPGLVAARRQLVDVAREHLAAAIDAIRRTSREFYPVFASAALISPQLSRLGTASEAFFMSPPADIPDCLKILRLAWAGWRGM